MLFFFLELRKQNRDDKKTGQKRWQKQEEIGIRMARKWDENEDKNGLKLRPRTKKESTKKWLENSTEKMMNLLKEPTEN